MSRWKECVITKSYIIEIRGNAVLIRVPQGNIYENYVFWYSTKLIIETKVKGVYKLLFLDESIFKIKRDNRFNNSYNMKEDMYEIRGFEMKYILGCRE